MPSACASPLLLLQKLTSFLSREIAPCELLPRESWPRACDGAVPVFRDAGAASASRCVIFPTSCAGPLFLLQNLTSFPSREIAPCEGLPFSWETLLR